jgi:hypothetical protein
VLLAGVPTAGRMLLPEEKEKGEITMIDWTLLTPQDIGKPFDFEGKTYQLQGTVARFSVVTNVVTIYLSLKIGLIDTATGTEIISFVADGNADPVSEVNKAYARINEWMRIHLGNQPPTFATIIANEEWAGKLAALLTAEVDMSAGYPQIKLV